MELKFIFLCDDTGLEECIDFCKENQKSLRHATILVPLEYIGLFKSINRHLRFVALPVKGEKAWSIANAMVAMQEVSAVGLILNSEKFSSVNAHANSLISVCRQMSVGCFLDGYGCEGMLRYIDEHLHNLEKMKQEELLRKKQEEAERERFLREQYIASDPIYWFDEEQRGANEMSSNGSDSNDSYVDAVDHSKDKKDISGQLQEDSAKKIDGSNEQMNVPERVLETTNNEQEIEGTDVKTNVQLADNLADSLVVPSDEELVGQDNEGKEEGAKKRVVRGFKPRKRRR